MVRLDEIGLRMELKFIKIIEGLFGKEGGVIYYEFGMCVFYVLVCVFINGNII